MLVCSACHFRHKESEEDIYTVVYGDQSNKHQHTIIQVDICNNLIYDTVHTRNSI